MTRLVRLNEVQYAETEHQIAGLVAQGFVPVPLEVAEVKEDKSSEGGKARKEGAAPPEGDEQH